MNPYVRAFEIVRYCYGSPDAFSYFAYAVEDATSRFYSTADSSRLRWTSLSRVGRRDLMPSAGTFATPATRTQSRSWRNVFAMRARRREAPSEFVSWLIQQGRNRVAFDVWRERLGRGKTRPICTMRCGKQAKPNGGPMFERL